MKRYKITAGIDHPASTMRVPVVRVNENEHGKWVKYEDVQELLQSILMLNVDGCVRTQFIEDSDLCPMVPDGKFLIGALE